MKTVLVANLGEIAVRIIRAVHAAGGGRSRLLRCEQNENTRALHERSRPVPFDPAKSLFTCADDSVEQTGCRVVLAGAGLQNQRAACRVAGVRFPSASACLPPPVCLRQSAGSVCG